MDRFSYERVGSHWELYDNGEFVCSCDSEVECREEIQEILKKETKE